MAGFRSYAAPKQLWLSSAASVLLHVLAVAAFVASGRNAAGNALQPALEHDNMICTFEYAGLPVFASAQYQALAEVDVATEQYAEEVLREFPAAELPDDVSSAAFFQDTAATAPDWDQIVPPENLALARIDRAMSPAAIDPALLGPMLSAAGTTHAALRGVPSGNSSAANPGSSVDASGASSRVAATSAGIVGGDEATSAAAHGVGKPSAPKPVSLPRGDYPAAARKSGHKGVVSLSLEVLPDGRIGQVAVQTSSGFTELDDAACQAVKKWRFKPGRSDEQAITSWTTVNYRYSLADD